MLKAISVALVALVLSLVAACVRVEDEAKRNIDDGIVYVRDVRTGLCFASGWSGDSRGGPILTNVPCTDAVVRLIK